MKVLVLGGDGFCGWPASLKLSSENHEVVIVDNFLRRKIDKELKTNSANFCILSHLIKVYFVSLALINAKGILFFFA